ncbi:hypothetical protein ENBRE01_0889 [Enteropsectra breve]|nr:hypothetical protein ENBRE01_0889 [Enteropsectra breve]
MKRLIILLSLVLAAKLRWLVLEPESSGVNPSLAAASSARYGNQNYVVGGVYTKISESVVNLTPKSTNSFQDAFLNYFDKLTVGPVTSSACRASSILNERENRLKLEILDSILEVLQKSLTEGSRATLITRPGEIRVGNLVLDARLSEEEVSNIRTADTQSQQYGGAVSAPSKYMLAGVFLRLTPYDLYFITGSGVYMRLDQEEMRLIIESDAFFRNAFVLCFASQEDRISSQLKANPEEILTEEKKTTIEGIFANSQNDAKVRLDPGTYATFFTTRSWACLGHPAAIPAFDTLAKELSGAESNEELNMAIRSVLEKIKVSVLHKVFHP